MASDAQQQSSTQQRPPAPSLFVGPPTTPQIQFAQPDLSLSQTHQTTSSARMPLLRQRSTLESQPSQISPTDTRVPVRAQKASTAQASQASTVPPPPDTTEATWAAMQSTLEEVEQSASGRSNVFGAEHSRALEELRNAQIALAQAWARSAADDPIEGDGIDVAAPAPASTSAQQQNGEQARASGSAKPGGGSTGVLDGSASGTGGTASMGMGMLDNDGARGKSGQGRTLLEEETENDIKLARKRREANDRYFERVNKGVVDVVAKLQEVAAKMGNVEMESQEIWGDLDTLNSQSSES